MDITKFNKQQLIKMQSTVQKHIEGFPSLTMAAEDLGVNKSTLGFIRDGDFGNVGEATFLKVQEKLGLSKREWGNYATSNFTAAVTMAKQTQESQHMAGLVGFTGAGKTHGLSMLAQKERNVYYALADTEMTKLDFLRELCKALGITRYEIYTRTEMRNAIVRKLKEEQQALLIIDDCGKLSDANLRIIQIIYDRTEFQCGILLAGMPFLKISIERKAEKNVNGFKELSRRIAYWEEMKRIPARDIRLVCESNGITDESAIHYFTRECQDYGTLRNMINNAHKASLKFKEPISAELLSKMNKNRM
jgi:DNA transposition AAA+ family ATPase